MKTLNLAYPEKSEIKYKIDRFPDGQQQITITNFGFNTKLVPRQYSETTIKSRLNNFHDLELIVCATKSLRNLGFTEIHLYTPYFLGSRSDRQFEEGGNNYLKDVICPIINSLEFDSVTCIDPHSDVLEACIKGFRKGSNLELVKFTVRDLCGFTHGRNPKVDKFILVSPDAGASKKIYKLAEQIGYKGDIITCSKERDSSGKLTKTVVSLTEPYYSKDFIIIDDICDGGATFISIAREFNKNINKMDRDYNPKIYLIVTHGIFSKGTAELSKYFNGIYTTNSYQDVLPEQQGWLKQLNVF